MKMLRRLLPGSLSTDLLLLLPVLIFAAWVYLIPPFQTFGYHPLFSDDAIFAILARKVLEFGPAGAFHLAWGPLLPWLNALLYKIFNLPLEEGPRIITGISLTLRILPIYFLAKHLFGRMAAVVSIILVTLYTFLLIPQEATLAEGLYSLIIFSGFLISYLALKTEKINWYFLAGLIWGLAYLARLEGWFFLTPLFLLTGLKFFQKPRKLFLTSQLFIACIIGFLFVSAPYISFIKQAYGTYTLNPRANIVVVAPGNLFTFHKDDKEISTVAQIYFSGDHKYYKSSLWHPAPSLFWTIMGRNWPLMPQVPIAYFHYFQTQTPILLFGGVLGILLILFLLFKNKFRLLLTVICLITLVFGLVDFFMVTSEFTSAIIFNPEANFTVFVDRFWRMLNTDGYPIPLTRDLIVVSVSLFWLISRKKYLSQLAHHIYTNRLKAYLPLTLFLGFLPLFFNSFANKYAITTGAMFSIFTGLLFASICSLCIAILRRYKPSFPYFAAAGLIYLIAISGFWWLNRPQFYQTIDTKEVQYKPRTFQDSYLKKPGLVILKDHGPGAKVAIFHEAPVFYAQGEIFYFAADSNIALEDTLKYFERNKVDYIVANSFQSFYTWKQLRPLMLTTTKLPGWKLIYSDPPAGAKIEINDKHTDMLVTIWKRVSKTP